MSPGCSRRSSEDCVGYQYKQSGSSRGDVVCAAGRSRRSSAGCVGSQCEQSGTSRGKLYVPSYARGAVARVVSVVNVNNLEPVVEMLYAPGALEAQ